MGYLEKLEKTRGGWIIYCGTSWCGKYIAQSDPQDFSGGKKVILEVDGCEECKARAQEVQEAQALMGRLGIPKGEEDNA